MDDASDVRPRSAVIGCRSLALGALLLACAGTEEAPADGVLALLGPEGRLSAETVATQEWRLFSPIYPALPIEGYPIDFLADGSVETDNLGGVERWRLDGDGALLLLGSASEVASYRFVFDECQNALASIIDVAAPEIGIVLRLASQPGLWDVCSGRLSPTPRPFCCEDTGLAAPPQERGLRRLFSGLPSQ